MAALPPGFSHLYFPAAACSSREGDYRKSLILQVLRYVRKAAKEEKEVQLFFINKASIKEAAGVGLKSLN